MGNSNSGHALEVPQAPPLWTQSLPRDAHRHKKHGAMHGTKVLPERIPGQRLKPTENGRNLQTQGTISSRNVSEIAYPLPGCPPPPILNHHSSMTALHHPSNSSSSFYPSNSGLSHQMRFGPAPSKSFASEPDLRGSSPASHVSLPTPSNTQHTIISESPTKGKIKSKKRYKAPLPPSPIQASISLPLENSQYVPSPNRSFENQSSVSSPASKSSKSKPKKIGLFRKKNESRMSNYELECKPEESKLKHIESHRVEGRSMQRERSTTPVQIQISSKKELKERARSLDNLQHEIRQSPQGLASSLHSLEAIDNINDEKQWQRVSCDNQKHNSSEIRRNDDINVRNEEKHMLENNLSSTLDRQQKNRRRVSSVERKLYERQLSERISEGILSSPVGDPKRFEHFDDRNVAEQRRSSSSCSSYKNNLKMEEVKDEWDIAEEEWLDKKKKSEILQKEIVHVVRNLRKTSVSPEPVIRNITAVNSKKDFGVSTVHVNASGEGEFGNDDAPKTFFFGMQPAESSKQNDLNSSKTALAKLNDQEEVNIIGNAVEYSRHSLKPKEKKRNLERDSWNRSLDYRERTRSRSKEKGLDNISKPEGKKNISREVDEFAATIERQKRTRKTADELSNSISRKGDGGYHSRQNSGSFYLENEASDEDNVIRMNLRPTLPRRQLELPRFSPNAAWRSLSVETSSRPKELHSDIIVNDDVFSIGEDQIHRYTRPTAPPRTSGEKSADSGISGDAGSPGPMQEFEPLNTDKVKTIGGPLAASSPVASARLNFKRTWTPAQDLDENSFEENNDHNGKNSLHQEISTMPKLTSRTNMFSKPTLINSHDEDDEIKLKNYRQIENIFSDELPSPIRYGTDEYQINTRSLQREKRASASHNKSNNIENGFQDNDNNDNWRENWSMSRSIPNSLNACDEPDGVDNSCRSKSDSRMTTTNQISENRGYNVAAKTTTPGYLLRGKSGHIMYLPEYKAYQVNNEKAERRIHQTENTKYSSNMSKCSSSPEQERKSPSGDENPEVPESSRWNTDKQMIEAEMMSKGKRFTVLNAKKSKKFSYQSTVRMMEKKMLEDKLSKEVEEKEKRRLQEVEAMMKVEQEFQLKREREKKRLKKELLLFQQQQVNHITVDSHALPLRDVFDSHAPPLRNVVDSHAPLLRNVDSHLPPLRNVIDSHAPSLRDPYVPRSADNQNRRGKCESPSNVESELGSHLPPLPSSPPPFLGHRQMSSYQSLPLELVNSTGYDNGAHPQQQQQQQQQFRLFSGFKKWVKSKKESRSGYQSDASSVTVNSGSRQDPDGAPASSPGRKNLDNIRAEIIAASKHRNGTGHSERDSGSSRYDNGSPAPSVISKESHLRTITPDSKRAISPDSRRSLSSETCPLTQELPEMRQEHRQYREYRRSSRKALLPTPVVHLKQSQKVSPVTHNYRRDFCHGNIPSSSMKMYLQHEDVELYSRHTNDSRKSKHSKRSSSADLMLEHDGVPHTNSLRRHYSSSKGAKHSVPNSIPPHHDPRFQHNGIRISPSHVSKAYPPPHISPYNPNKGYRPVNFSPSQGKILTVT